MIRRSIILLSLFCAVLSAIVGYLSYDSIQQAKKRVGPPITMACATLLQAYPEDTARIVFEKFVPGKYVASIPKNDEGDWDSVCVPLFPNNLKQNSHGYRAVLVCFKGIPNREALDALVHSEEIEVLYWPRRQRLNSPFHSQMAQQYKNMDLVNCPVLHYGFSAANPVLGESSFQICKLTGMASLFVLVATLVLSWVFRLVARLFRMPQSHQDEEDLSQSNRAGLPESTSVLDQVTLMRDRNPSY